MEINQLTRLQPVLCFHTILKSWHFYYQASCLFPGTTIQSYNIIEETFKTVSSHDIKTAILIPKNLKPGRHLIIYHIHGGFLVMGSGLFAPFFPKWVDKLALQNSAIIVSPDYRLLPSANGLDDVLEDVEDGWLWTKNKLPGILKEKAPGHSIDFSHALLAGGSAGGYCSTQLALSHPEDFHSLAVVYPLLDTKDRLYLQGALPDEPTVLRMPLEEIPSMEDTLAWIEKTRKDPESGAGFERTPFAVAACQRGIFSSHMLDNKGLDKTEFRPRERVEAGAKLPKHMWIMHGDDDSTVPIRGSQKFVDLVAEKLPETVVRYDPVAGEDHGFEFDEKRWESFADEALAFVRDAWLA